MPAEAVLEAAPANLRLIAEDEEPAVLEPGDELAPYYTVIEHLSRGESLDVYAVWSDERHCRCVAKVPRPDRMDHERTRKRLVTEGRLLERLTHPHIVRAYQTIEEPHPIVILETLGGETLSHLIAHRARRLPLLDVAFLGVHLCSAVMYLHRHGYLHRDLKPGNIIATGGIAKVIDLSLACHPGERRGGAGTPAYMAPEQIKGGYLGPQTDVWGIGVVLYKAAAGQGAFDADEPEYPQLDGRAEPIRKLRRMPAAVAAIIDACLEPEPGGRPALEALASELGRFARQASDGRPSA